MNAPKFSDAKEAFIAKLHVVEVRLSRGQTISRPVRTLCATDEFRR